MDPAIVTAISGALTGAAAGVTGLITTNLPVILGVTVAFVGLRFARRIVGSLGH